MSCLESWYCRGSECLQTEAQGQIVNVDLTRLGRSIITQDKATEKNKIRVKLFAFVIECVDVFRQLTYSSIAYSGR
jgi:hypothetical protein